MDASSDAAASRGGTATLVEALGYRSLRYVSRSLEPFHVLVGPNASGKSTFLDVIAFLGDVLRVGIEAAVRGDLRLNVPVRAPDARHLTWMRKGDRFELAVELGIPVERRSGLNGSRLEACRYEMTVDVTGPLRIVGENVWLKPLRAEAEPSQPTLFPQSPEPPGALVHPVRKQAPKGWKKVVSRGEEPERVLFVSETSGWQNPFRIHADRSALASLPEDEQRFPVATWLRQFLLNGVQRIALSGDRMREPSPATRARHFLPDGSNLPHMVALLAEADPERFRGWVDHVREALPDLVDISTREREEDRARYLVVRYRSGLEAPSWLVSDGTLRVLALTLLAYLPDVSGIYLVEEPENGIHPRAVENVFQSLSSVYGAQVLLATHSPVVASMASLDQILCFARTTEGATDIVTGRRHPRLAEWRGGVDVGTLLAAGVLS